VYKIPHCHEKAAEASAHVSGRARLTACARLPFGRVFCADIAVDKTPRDVPKWLSIAVFLFFVASHFLILFCTPNSYLDSTGVLSSAEKVQSSIRSLKMCAVEDMSGDMSEDPVEEGERSSPLVRYGTDTTTGPGLQHLGTTQVRPRTGDHFTETISDYLGFFQELQIDPMYHATFWTSIIYRYRQTTRHLPLLKRGTEASIKNMTDDVLRAYGERVWGHKSEWRSELAEGEEMLIYDKDGANTR
jgi:hypothetical protein